VTAGFVPPPYPHDRLEELKALAANHPDGRGMVDLSIGTPCDPPPPAVVAALSLSGSERGYPPSVGSPRLREAAAGWLGRRFGVTLPASQLAACVGTKEWVATTPHWLRLRTPDRDTVLYPATSYPTYAMGATLAGCRAVPYTSLSDVVEDDAGRALCLWVNSPSNPTGELVDLGAAAAWGRARQVPVLSDECYAEFTWDGPPRSILKHGTDGVLAAHSLSKRSNLAGVRVGFYAGDGDLVGYLSEVRKHAGFMVPGPVQAAGAVAFGDDEHVSEQRERYRRRLALLAEALGAPLPAGAFYLWVAAAGGDGWALTAELARTAGCLVSPGEFYGPLGAGFVRVAAVQPDDRQGTAHVSGISRDVCGPVASSRKRMSRRQASLADTHSRWATSQGRSVPAPGQAAISAPCRAMSSPGRRKPRNSTICRASRARTRSDRSYAPPSRLHRTRSALGATAAVGSICRNARRSTTATRWVGRGASRSCAWMAMRRASSRSRRWTTMPRP